MRCITDEVVVDDIAVADIPTVVCEAKLLNAREYAAVKSVLNNGYGIPRTELYIPNPRTGNCYQRKTIWNWDCILQAHPLIPDYRRDPQTQQSLWNPGQDWNPHQEWCLRKVAVFMQTKGVYRNTESKKKKYKAGSLVTRYPTYRELEQYLDTNHALFTHKQFLKERFKYVH
jgi:hypothetical protein